MKGSSTMKTIASELGISVSTVSRAINGKTVVKEETKNKILDLAKKYSYTPNEIARSLQKSSTETIAVVLPDISETFFGIIVKEIQRVVEQSGYIIILADSNEKVDTEKKYLDMLFKRRIDALVLATVDCSGKTVRAFLDNDTPVVFIDNVPELYNIDAITVDNYAAGKLAVEHFCSNGHKNIAAIIGSDNETTGIERLEGFKLSLNENKLSFNKDLIAFGDYKQQSGYDAMVSLLKNREKNPFSAVFVTSEKMSYGALSAIYDFGLKVPDDISLIGFDVHNQPDFMHIAVTSVCQPEEEIGKKVGELITSRLLKTGEHFADKKRQVLMPFLSVGNTVKKLD